jgi:hypothetical protein
MYKKLPLGLFERDSTLDSLVNQVNVGRTSN